MSVPSKFVKYSHTKPLVQWKSGGKFQTKIVEEKRNGKVTFSIWTVTAALRCQSYFRRVSKASRLCSTEVQFFFAGKNDSMSYDCHITFYECRIFKISKCTKIISEENKLNIIITSYDMRKMSSNHNFLRTWHSVTMTFDKNQLRSISFAK